MAARVSSLESGWCSASDRDRPPFHSDTQRFGSGVELASLQPGEEPFRRCSAKLRGLSGSGGSAVKTELNLLLDELLSHNYSNQLNNHHIPAQDVCLLLVHTSRLVPHSQEHLVIKLCQLIHQLLNQLQVIVDEQTLDTLVSYCTRALWVCSSWTHSEILLALSSLVYGNGPRCQRHLPELLGQNGVLLNYGDPSQSDIELRRSSLHCMANLCLGVPGHPYLEESYRGACYRIFLQTLQSPKPSNVEDMVFCTLLQSALKGTQYFLNGVKWKASPDQDLGSLLALLKKYMFHGLPGINVEMPQVLYPAPLPQYETVPAAKAEPSQDTPTQRKLPASQQNKKRKSRGKGKKARVEGKTDGGPEEGDDEEPSTGPVRSGGGGGAGRGEGRIGWPQTSTPFALPLQPGSGTQFLPCWKKGSSDSEFSDPEGGMQSKLRLYQARVRQSALQCFLAVVKSVEKRVLYGYWSSFIPDTPGIGSPPSLTLITIALKDPSPKVRAGSLQVLSALLEGSRQFLSAAEDTSAPRQAFTPFSATLAASLRELHRCLLLALIAESSSQTLTQVIKCLAHLVSNVPYNRLRPGLLSPLWKQIRPYVRHRDVNVRVSSLTLFGALVCTQAPLPEVHLLLQQPGPSTGPGVSGGATPQEPSLNWRQPGRRERDASLPLTGTGVEDVPVASCWLLQLCVALVTQAREEPYSDSDAAGSTSGALEPSPVRLEALQVLAHLVKGYFPLAQTSLLELAQLSARCLSEQDPSVQLHGAKLLEELGTGIIQQYRADAHSAESASAVPLCQVVQFWSEVLTGPLIGALQNDQHPTLQTSACDTLSSILPQAFSQLPDKTQVFCITVLLGLTYSENSLVKAAAVRALGVYILFPCLREDVMFVADTANAILTVLDDRSPNVRAKAAWSLGNLTDTLIVNMESVGLEFQEEVSDMLLLKMLRTATQASGDKDRVKSNAVRALGNLLHFLQPARLGKPAFEQPLEQAMRALIDTVRGDATMKVRWNACYALGNVFRNPGLPLGTAGWSKEAYSALSSVVTSCKNFKVRIKSAAALSVPATRDRYGDTQQFAEVWCALAQALEHSEETEDFLEYRYCASLRGELCHALFHLLSLCQLDDLATVGTSLSCQSKSALQGLLVQYLSDTALVSRHHDVGGEDAGDQTEPRDRLKELDQTLSRLKELEAEVGADSKSDLDTVKQFLEDVAKNCETIKASDALDVKVMHTSSHQKL
ncbi:HEAT repeat-containing protein 6 [Pygocentrus nattereri]|uniref:HEAT repeat-containing protein 6 n=1 Tax=Pygocentrus nattereri TaxID=42514 RepID=A0A3B4DZD0_PYGNA|nr:HEAT repeat-containing protein 6 [Pygocentrus nattereri]